MCSQTVGEGFDKLEKRDAPRDMAGKVMLILDGTRSGLYLTAGTVFSYFTPGTSLQVLYSRCGYSARV